MTSLGITLLRQRTICREGKHLVCATRAKGVLQLCATLNWNSQQHVSPRAIHNMRREPFAQRAIYFSGGRVFFFFEGSKKFRLFAPHASSVVCGFTTTFTTVPVISGEETWKKYSYVYPPRRHGIRFGSLKRLKRSGKMPILKGIFGRFLSKYIAKFWPPGGSSGRPPGGLRAPMRGAQHVCDSCCAGGL